MKIKLSKSQWENIGKKAGWMKVSMLTHLLQEIEMQGEEGLNIGSMSYEELQDAKQYEKSGVIIKKDDKYFINKDHKPDFEKSKKYMEDLIGKEDKRLSFSFGTTPEEVIKERVNKQTPSGYPMHIKSQNEWSVIAKVVNQGIDSHLEAFTRSTFDNKTGKCLVHPEEMTTFLRRLYENGDEESWDLRGSILETLGIEEI